MSRTFYRGKHKLHELRVGQWRLYPGGGENIRQCAYSFGRRHGRKFATVNVKLIDHMIVKRLA